MPTNPINWHQSPIARRIIARLDRGNVERTTRIAIPADIWVYTGKDRWSSEALLALEYIRTASIELELGYAFEETNTDETLTRRVAYLDAMDRAPEVSQVLEAAFAERAVEASARAAESYVPAVAA